MLIKNFIFNPIEENTYVLADEDSKRCMIIDAGCLFPDEKEELAKYIETNGFVVDRLINTHLHLDHCFGNRFVSEKYGILPEAHENDEQLLSMMNLHSKMWGLPFDEEPQTLGGYLYDGDVIVMGNIHVKVLHVPGHSQGGLAFYIEDGGVLFSGDTLFYESIGRSALPGGNQEQLVESIQTKLFSLPDETKVYTGHGRATSIRHEKEHNPYV